MSMEKTYAYEVEKIFTSWYSSLCYFAFRYVQDDETARDIVQEVFVRLMEKRQAFQSEQHLKNFLYLTIKNDCLNHLRNRLSREHYLSYLKHEGEQDEFECRMIETEIFRRLRKAREKLPIHVQGMPIWLGASSTVLMICEIPWRGHLPVKPPCEWLLGQ